MTYVLRKTVGSWSPGTRVEIVNQFDFEETKFLEVEVQAGDKPLIEVRPSDLVERRQRAYDEGTIA